MPDRSLVSTFAAQGLCGNDAARLGLWNSLTATACRPHADNLFVCN